MTVMDPTDPMCTLNDPNLTFHHDKISCMRGAYFAHMILAYLVFVTGIAAMVSRVVPAVKWTHVWFGRAYVIAMLWATGTALVIHNSGLPAPILLNFVWVLGGLTIAWVLIKFHESRIQRQAFLSVQQQVAVTGLKGDLQQLVNTEQGRIAASKTFLQRFFSLKALHGILMFVSWINIAGRVFGAKWNSDFTCHTYPVYKPFQSPDPDQLVPLSIHDPQWDAPPWEALGGVAGWGLVFLFVPFFAAALVGAVYSLIAAKQAKTQQQSAATKATAKVLPAEAPSA